MAAGRKRKQEVPDSKLGETYSIPRSLGDVLTVIRMDLGLTLEQMGQKLDDTESRFELPKKKGGKHPGAKISSWEKGSDNTPFAYLHRYGTLSGTLTGIIHVVSLIYANWRDAADQSKSRSDIDSYFAQNRNVAEGLRALADYIDRCNPTPGQASPLHKDENLNARGVNFDALHDLLGAYRKGAGTNLATSKAKAISKS